jgi:hypothetical protein
VASKFGKFLIEEQSTMSRCGLPKVHFVVIIHARRFLGGLWG